MIIFFNSDLIRLCGDFFVQHGNAFVISVAAILTEQDWWHSQFNYIVAKYCLTIKTTDSNAVINVSVYTGHTNVTNLWKEKKHCNFNHNTLIWFLLCEPNHGISDGFTVAPLTQQWWQSRCIIKDEATGTKLIPVLVSYTWPHVDIFEVKLTFEMLTMRGHQHSFSTHERLFLWKCQSFFEAENVSTCGGIESPSIGLIPNAITIWVIRAIYLLSHGFEYWLWWYRYFWSKVRFGP